MFALFPFGGKGSPCCYPLLVGAAKETSQEIYKIAFVVVGPWNTLPKLFPKRVGISFPTDKGAVTILRVTSFQRLAP